MHSCVGFELLSLFTINLFQQINIGIRFGFSVYVRKQIMPLQSSSEWFEVLYNMCRCLSLAFFAHFPDFCWFGLDAFLIRRNEQINKH